MGETTVDNMNTYIFTHKFTDKFEVTMTTHNDTAHGILDDFVAFLRGCQFADCSIKEALEWVVDDLTTE